MVHLWNHTWGGGRCARPPVADRTPFVGQPEDIPDRPFGLGLANRRAYARHYYDIVGYILGFDPADHADRAGLRARLGYDERRLIVCAVGGTSVGADLLRLCAAAHAHIRERVPDARMVLVCGPRLARSDRRARGRRGARLRPAPARALRRVRPADRAGRRHDHA